MHRFLFHHPKWRFAYTLCLSAFASIWRRLMFRTTFIAVTGSVGKTTATSCLLAALSSCYRANGTHGNNSRGGIAQAVLQTRPNHRFSVIEVGTMRPGALRRAAWTIAPDSAVVLAVASVHIDVFPTLDDVAREKSQILSRLGRRSLAVLNGDDPRVAAMAAGCRGRVVTFGRSPHFDIWASEVSSIWPARLSFRVHWGTESRLVQTNLVGEHWLSSVLGALAAALSHGADLERATAAVQHVTPYHGRLEPMPLPSGAIALRDDYNSSRTSLTAALRVMEQARVPGRRILVTTRVGHTTDSFQDSFRSLGEMASRSVDLVILFGDDHLRALNLMVEGGIRPQCIRSFADLWGAAEWLAAEARAGDLVLLRTCNPYHAERVYFAQLGSVGCRRAACSIPAMCDHCPELRPGLEKIDAAPPPRPVWPGGNTIRRTG
jgi:UDP-N-acetylmuramoyl-tripeptide--D-alanyl-D-alanine ligase